MYWLTVMLIQKCMACCASQHSHYWGVWKIRETWQADLELGVLVIGIVGGLAQVHEDARGLLQLHQALEAHQHAQLGPHPHIRQLPPPATPARSQCV